MNQETDHGSPAMAVIRVGAMVIAGILLHAALAGVPAAAGSTGFGRADYHLPAEIAKEGLSFAGEKIPVERKDVRRRIQEQLNFVLMDRRSKLIQWLERLDEYGPAIRKILVQEGVSPDLIYIAVLTSDLSPTPKARQNGVGWWSLPAPKPKKNENAVPLVTDDWDDRRDPVLSTRIACSVFKGINPGKGGTDWLMAICAFADGSDRVDDVVGKAQGFSYWDLVLPTLSEVLIPRLIALKLIDTHRSFYGVNVQTGPPLVTDYLGRLPLTKDLPLHVVAKWCGITPKAMWELNPGTNPTTGILPKADKKNPAGFPLRVPKGMENRVRQFLVKEGYLPN